MCRLRIVSCPWMKSTLAEFTAWGQGWGVRWSGSVRKARPLKRPHEAWHVLATRLPPLTLGSSQTRSIPHTPRSQRREAAHYGALLHDSCSRAAAHRITGSSAMSYAPLPTDPLEYAAARWKNLGTCLRCSPLMR